MKLSLDKKIKQRIISFTTAFAMMTNALPMSGLSGIISPLFTIGASAADYVPQEASVFNKSNDSDPVSLSTTDALVSYCWHYNRNTSITITNHGESQTIGFAKYHQNDTLIIAFTGGGEISSDFEGLGSDSYPFGGMLKFGGANYNLNAHRALFNYVYDSVKFQNNADSSTENIIFTRLSSIGTNESKPLLADHVRHDTRDGKTVAEWHIELASSNTNTYSGVIGEIESGASVKLTYNNKSEADAVSASDVGEICGIMQSGSSMELTYSATNAHNITSSDRNAGGLVGTMSGNASLTIKNIPAVALNATSTSAYAGGLVGELTSQATITNQTGSAIPVSGSITGGSGAGGLFGHYTNSASEFDLAGYNNTATVDGNYCGGVFGVLENSTALTVKNTGAGTLNVNSGTTGNTEGYFGGIAGKYTANALSDSLVLNGLTLTANANAAYSAFGGAIGIVDPEAYVQTTGTMSVTASGTTSSTYFGGLVGATSNTKGVFVDLGNFTLNTGNEQFKGGGVVGLFNNGVLRLSGTTTMTNAKPASAASCGQLVGDNNNVLTYAASGWTFNRSNGAKTDDLGTWGEVVRVAESDIVTVDSTAHTVTLKAAETSMGSAADFAKTALNIQLNQGSDYDCLKFTSGNNTRTYLLGTGLSLSADISLAGTGITGFMRDGGDVSKIGSFTGTLNGNEHTITLAAGENYGTGASGQTEGMGQIYRHQHNGLFAVMGGTVCAVSNLTVDGSINVSNCVDGMNIGGIASRNSGDIMLTKVTANEKVNYNESTKVTATEAAGKNIGGYIGFVGTNGTITINGNSSIGAAFNLKGSHENWNVYGGAIGKITAGEFTVNIGTKDDANDKLTNSLTTNISGITASGSNSDSGGLIGYITAGGSYGSRTVNLNNVEFSSCTVGNAASTNGGGFLGYAWLKTTTNVNGVTVTNGTINNSTAPNVGVMLYSSTGKMKVDSLSINGLTMSAGGGTSLGMIVNKAYTVNDKNEVNGALYLDVLNAGYDLTGTTAPAQATGIFDEIAAYSAPNVINGGAGVISVNMNTTREGTSVKENNSTSTQKLVKITQTGTYQNRLKTGDSCANPNSRYYYNVDNMSSSDGGQNLVLWSLSKYAYSGIRGEFVHTDTHAFGTTLTTTLSGAADLTGLSFYPLASANDNYSIGDLTLTFDYSGIYGTAESTFGTANPTDSYNRDPAVSNQHYLMHSGLFIDQPSGKSLTVTGKLSLGGTFMEDSTHQGVLISGTENGNFTVKDSGLIELDGIKPMNGASAYKGGYLLINNIARASELVDPPSLTIKNTYTTNKYSESSYTDGHTNDTVAKSLLGAASGKDLNIVFSHIKLDARSLTNNAVKTDVALEALYNAYGTYNSIFTDSTLLASINTDQAAKLEYNYTKAVDWGTGTPRYVTYGKEVSTSVENAGKQKKYYGDVRHYTNPVSDADSEYDFSTGFLKYVAAAYNSTQTNGQFSRELKVNVMVEGLTEGCGTYNDPYIITSASQLVALSKLLQMTGTNSDMSTLNLPKTASDFDSIEENTTGARWCTDKNGTGFHAEYKAETNDTGYESAENGASEWTIENVKYYLANAYYMVNADVVLDNTFVGLGGKSANLAFRGVIIGGDVADEVEEGEEQTYHKAVITNNSGNPFINVSNGCVIKDINIEVGTDISLDQAKNAPNGNNHAAFGYDSQCKYYGGIIGEIMGGDNIIDNSYVTFESGRKITLTGSSGTIVPVGGYVGVVVFGGLIFKNMDARKTTVSSTRLNVTYQKDNKSTAYTYNLADNRGQEAWAAIYVNPIVGRVINGYAVNETGGNALDADGNKVQQFSVTEDGKYHNEGRTSGRSGNQHTLKNGTKHYSIADIDPYYGKTAAQWNALTVEQKNALMLDVTDVPKNATTDGNIDVPNAQALFVLSLITQSTAGTAQELFGTGSGTHTDETVETSRTDDGNGNITVYKTRTITDIDDSLCDYANSLSYGTYGTGSSTAVYGMSHTAIYSDVGTSESTSSDYTTYVGYDTAANDALPYIISHYTVGGLKTSSTTTVGEPEVVPASTEGKTEIFDGSLDDLDGKEIYIYNDGYYMHPDIIDSTNKKGLDALTTLPSYKLLVTKQSNGKYTLTYNNGSTQYISLPSNRELTFTSTFSSTNCEFTINKLSNGKFEIYNDNLTITQKYIGLRNKTHFYGQPVNSSNASNSSVDGTEFDLYVYTPPSSTTTTTITTTITNTNTVTYPARCVTSTAGYYDITLSGSGTYQLPDSFRGLGCVGNNNDQYALKVDTFDGKGLTIDEDIYLNKFTTDNYFNAIHTGLTQNYSSDTTVYSVNKEGDGHHGIGLFDSVVTSGADSILTHFTVSGSVNTEIYKDGYNISNQEQTVYGNDKARFLSVGGVCGSSNGNMTYLNFDQIILNQLSVCGSCAVGGILGYSNNQNYLNNKYNNIPLTINKCSAADLSLKMNSSLNLNSNNNQQPRNAIGGYVGKCVEGMVIITGDTTSGSNVTIKLFGYETLTDVTDHRTVAGGLVGFAGNGCTIKDMNVSPSTGYTVEIGSDYTGYAGGLVGLMQPAKDGGSSCVAVFENCIVEKINVNGHYAGGFYGGKWINSYSPYSISIDNCQMIGDSTNNNTIKGNSLRDAEGYAGGFLGCGNVYTDGNPNIEIKDCMVSHYNITTTAYNNGEKGYAGGFIGYTGAQAGDKSITCYIHDSSVENCTIGTSGNYAGGAIGRVVRQSAKSQNKILGYNIKLDTVTLGGTYNGAWIGWVKDDDDTTSIQFTGVGIYGNGFTQNVGNRGTFSNASFVFADYDKACGGTISAGETERVYPINVSTFNKESNVTMRKYPYVNINPSSSMGTGEVISGDGAVLRETASQTSDYSGKTAEKTMALKIYEDIVADTDTRRYTTFGAFNSTNNNGKAEIYNGNMIDYYMKRTIDNDGDRISTYKTEKGTMPEGMTDDDDFAVVVIANHTDEETTNLINRYIQLVTNTSTDYTKDSDYYDIDIKTCKYEHGKFVIDESATPGLITTNVAGQKFALNSDHADSNKANTFTLVDVQFKDPLTAGTDSEKIAYHLYVPVYTVKQMEVDFYSAVKTGSNSVSYTGGVPSTEYSELMNSNGKHLDSIETWITQYIRYSYSSGDINMLLNTGNVKWNTKKKVIFNTFYLSSDFVRLPLNTYMVLVDPNGNSDVEYYAQNLNGFATYYDSNHANKEGWLIELDKFKDSSDRAFEVNTFNAMIAKDIVERSTGNLLYTDGTSGDYDVYRIQADGTAKYYKYATDETAPASYSLSVPDEYVLNEDYYISMYIPDNNSNALYFYDIKAPTELTGAKTLKVNEKNTYQVIAADLYTQDTKSRMSVLPEDQQITTSNRKLFVDASTSIRINNPNATAYLMEFPLYHSFVLSLNRYSDSGVANNIIGLDDNRITAKYNIGAKANANSTEVKEKVLNFEDNYINIETAEIMSRLLAAHDANKPLVIYSYIELDFDENKLDEEFPQKISETTIGVNVAATSNLAYDEERLVYTSMTAPLSDNHYYYRESVNSAKLDYTAVTERDEYDKIGKMSQNQSRLGINGYTPDCYQQEYMPINTEAKYNVSAISETDLAKAKNLRLTISLSKKTDKSENGTVTSVEYKQILNLLNYLDDEVLITSGNYGEGNGVTHHIDEDASSLVVEIPIGQCDVEDNIYSIGIAFSAKTGENFHDYANYMVTLRTELVYTDNNDQVKAVENSGISDYVIYTNAKVFPALIPKAN